MPSIAHSFSTDLSGAQPHALPRRLINRIRAYYIAERTRNALLRLSPRELDDIGITRGDIDNIARDSAGL
jgi:uncharacterized protein YjiS (DUF1127 family)